MTVTAKICGVNDALAMSAAVSGGASHVGFVFYPASPRAVTMEEAKELAALVPSSICKVGLFVDADDALIDSAINGASLDMLQLHGREAPERVAALKTRTGRPVMKVISIAIQSNFAIAERYYEVADWLMFDAKPPKGVANPMPGGNARRFDWQLLSGRDWPMPWMLAGGIKNSNVAEAVALTGANVVDCSSGVETRRGHKNATKISAFLSTVAQL